MAGVALCEPRHLYNIINQCRRFPRLAEPNYLCLLDARTQREFDESHIVTARRIERGPTGEYLIPNAEELGYVRHCVVYDFNTSSLSYCDCDEEQKETDAQMDGGAVLVFSSLGISRSSTAIMAYLMHSCRLSLKGAWDYLLKCKPSMRPHRGFVEQLSAWESQVYGSNLTDISEPNY
ncbi:serine/threonine/tyrosine-interacting-like protein 1 [Pitangus sulphuratus]|nr:serine/threonine/tyrosine-interacting-like protein 1 [Pitangus sulphuratus]